MPDFLVDVNLPYHFSLWKGDNYIHQNDIDDEWTDTQIWNYARENDLTIIQRQRFLFPRDLSPPSAKSYPHSSRQPQDAGVLYRNDYSLGRSARTQ